MRARDLIGALSTLPPDTEVVLVDTDTGWLLEPNLVGRGEPGHATPDELSKQNRIGIYGSYSAVIADK